MCIIFERPFETNGGSLLHDRQERTPVWFAKAEKDLGVDADALLEQGGSYKIDKTGIEQTETVTESAQ